MGQSQTKIPGVVYSQDYRPPSDDELPVWRGLAHHNITPGTEAPSLQYVDTQNAPLRPGPEAEPYTFWERVGAMPISLARVRPRQYYYPVTDFTMFGYDQASPEERLLKANWMARMFDFNYQLPVMIWGSSLVFAIAMPPVIRLPVLMSTGITCVFAECTRVYVAGAREREMLDDFLHAKECWYIKNVETQELELATMGDDVEAYMDADEAQKLADMERQLLALRDGMIANNPDSEFAKKLAELPVGESRVQEMMGGKMEQPPQLAPLSPDMQKIKHMMERKV
jgi:hypothetical protein